MNKTLQEGIALAKELNEALANEKPNCDVIICTPFIHLASVTPLVDAAKIGVGAENCADKASGAYTGEVSAEMVASTGAKYVILGHSERRAYYGETVAILEEKVKLAEAIEQKIFFTAYNVIIDDRDNISIGAKIKDVKILGTPYMIVLGDKSKEDEFEIESIKTGEKTTVKFDDLSKFFLEIKFDVK